MKKLIHISLACAGLLALASCEKDLEPIILDDARLNFVFYNYSNEEVIAEDDVEEEMKESSYSFALQSAITGEDLQSDTVWFEVSTMGRLSDQDRTVELQQIATGKNDAVPGVHFVPFDDAELLAKSFVPANQNRARIPIVVLHDASLDAENASDVRLQFTFKDNGYFKPGYETFSTRTLFISGKMAEPSNWSQYYCDDYFGDYTPYKHELMINWTGENWDEDYLDEIFSADTGYVEYLGQMFRNRLAEENEKRHEQGLGDLIDPSTGEPVSFDPIY